MQGVAEIVDNAVVLRFKFTVRPINPTMDEAAALTTAEAPTLAGT
jgi:hypothetical protein